MRRPSALLAALAFLVCGAGCDDDGGNGGAAGPTVATTGPAPTSSPQTTTASRGATTEAPTTTAGAPSTPLAPGEYRSVLARNSDVFDDGCPAALPSDAAREAADRFREAADALAAVRAPTPLARAHAELVAAYRRYARYYDATAAQLARAGRDVRTQQEALSGIRGPRQAAASFARARSVLAQGGYELEPRRTPKERYEGRVQALIERAGPLRAPDAPGIDGLRAALRRQAGRYIRTADLLARLEPPDDASGAHDDLTAGYCRRGRVLEEDARSPRLRNDQATRETIEIQLRALDSSFRAAFESYRAAGYQIHAAD